MKRQQWCYTASIHNDDLMFELGARLDNGGDEPAMGTNTKLLL